MHRSAPSFPRALAALLVIPATAAAQTPPPVAEFRALLATRMGRECTDLATAAALAPTDWGPEPFAAAMPRIRDPRELWPPDRRRNASRRRPRRRPPGASELS